MASKKGKYKELATNILQNVGGVSNVASVTHCMTRLRFNLKDSSIPKDADIKKMSGVLGVARSGGQYQVIIGQIVPDVYSDLLAVSDGKIAAQAPIDENLDGDKPKEKWTWKRVGSTILNKLAGSMVPLIPVMMVGGMFKMFATVFGPQLLNVLTANSDLYKTFTFVGDAAFYFLPILIGYTSAIQFKTSKVMGMLMGAIMLDPNLLQIVNSKAAFSIYGIPMFKVNYSSTVIPIILTVWIMSYIYKLIDNYIPATLGTIFTPTLTVLIMLPLELTVLGPIGGIIGTGFGNAIMSFSKLGGVATVITIVIIGGLWEFLVMTGMHIVLLSSMLLIFAQGGTDPVVSIAAMSATIAVSGMCLGTALRMKNKEAKAEILGFLVAGLVGGVTEPALYGAAVKYRRPFLGIMAGGAAGALYGGIMHVAGYMPAASNFLGVLGFAGGTGASNLINAIISLVIGFVVAAIVSYILGVDEKEIA